jgi:hypothetical protein
MQLEINHGGTEDTGGRQSHMLGELITNRRIESFHIDEFSTSIGISSGYNLLCECLLRFVGNDGAFITGEDHGQKFGLPEPFDAGAQISNYILGKTITAVELRIDSGDLTLRIENGQIELICSSAGYENWQLNGPDFLFIGYGGRVEKS